MKLKNRKLALVIALVLFPVLALACGADDEGSGQAAMAEPETGRSESAQVIGDAGRGRFAFDSEGCISCHATDSKRIVGPGLGGITARSDEAYIRESILDSRAVIVDGYPGVMPNFSKYSDQKVADLIAYLSTLK